MDIPQATNYLLESSNLKSELKSNYLFINLRSPRDVFVPSSVPLFVRSFVRLASVRFGQLLR